MTSQRHWLQGIAADRFPTAYGEDCSPLDTGSQAKPGGVAPAVPSNGRPHRARLGVVLGIVGLVAAMARLPLIRTPVDVSPDGCEYLGIARHLAGEHRW